MAPTVTGRTPPLWLARILPPHSSQPAPSLRPHRELITGWLLLLLDSGASYGYELRRELDAHRLDVDPSVVYRTLRKLERDGGVASRWRQSAAGPRRRFYRLTAEGRRQLDEIAALITDIRDIHGMFVQAHERVARARAADAPAPAVDV